MVIPPFYLLVILCHNQPTAVLGLTEDHRLPLKDWAMEEYRDLEITSAAFVETLDQPEFKNHAAGIVLQAYLPDAFSMQKQLTAWARKRVEE